MDPSFGAALAAVKAAAAAGDLGALALAKEDLAAARKGLDLKSNRKKRKEKPGVIQRPAEQHGGLQQPARLPGFGSAEYWAAQPDNPAWAHYPEPVAVPTRTAADGRTWTQDFEVDEPEKATVSESVSESEAGEDFPGQEALLDDAIKAMF